mmetsp:Transcript_644/g.1915  ORF Transcript_644/g.1915 Transcript_644/m.1915 type:complete len:162 (-) Transcript_644:68-553(-)
MSSPCRNQKTGPRSFRGFALVCVTLLLQVAGVEAQRVSTRQRLRKNMGKSPGKSLDRERQEKKFTKHMDPSDFKEAIVRHNDGKAIEALTQKSLIKKQEQGNASKKQGANKRSVFSLDDVLDTTVEEAGQVEQKDTEEFEFWDRLLKDNVNVYQSLSFSGY